MADINLAGDYTAHAEQGDWQTAWTRLPDGGFET